MSRSDVLLKRTCDKGGQQLFDVGIIKVYTCKDIEVELPHVLMGHGPRCKLDL